MIIQTGNESELGAAGIQEDFAAAHSDFFDSFQTIGNEGRADDEQLSDAVLGEADEVVVGIRLQPRLSSEPGLKGDGITDYARLVHERLGRLEALHAVASPMRAAGDITALFHPQAMAARGV